jgi:hypothetical protein
MFKFQCIGKDFQPFQDHFQCICADDLFAKSISSRKLDSIHVKVEHGAGK